ncbi:hypothetical protein MNEG_7800 [Monoraphidium neglectum]|uniref:Protein phosphatase inhibitor 2 n=1 Tax=Monoraphidium neglectum TaxID=145388 RepID=A0A0D2JLT9_9CHLO|nr:hypothetical protein MNEG_7800 [Monoraphidium neglectum]KIZ00158.1 hypothetical protein MNEG_7800 [Monoraphidium neglectum]|eukprot:XP_013899177.1 hypothetical protein MNEG_7800 [Monoraphidium neglectum]
MDPVDRSSSRKHVVWDEENLAENEKIQAEFANVSVPEPKTPYHGPSSPGDELEDDMRPLALGEEGEAQQPKMSAFDFFLGNGSADAAPSGGSPPHDAIAPANAAVRGRARSDSGVISSGKRTERSMSEVRNIDRMAKPRSMTSSDGSGGLSSEKRQRFEAARRAHYNMREALRLGRALTSASEDDTRGDGGDGSSDSEGEGGQDEAMLDCGSSRLQEGHPNGEHGVAATGAARASRNGRARQRRRHLAFDEPPQQPQQPQEQVQEQLEGAGGASEREGGSERQGREATPQA